MRETHLFTKCGSEGLKWDNEIKDVLGMHTSHVNSSLLRNSHRALTRSTSARVRSQNYTAPTLS